MGYFAAPGHNGQIRGVIIGESSSKTIAAKKKVRKIEAAVHIPDEVILASARVESMSSGLIHKVVLSRRNHRSDDDRGKAHREHEKYKLGRRV